MTQFNPCKSCGSEIAATAKACPKCGHPQKGIGFLVLVTGSIYLVAFLSFLFAFISMAYNPSDKPRPVWDVVTGGFVFVLLGALVLGTAAIVSAIDLLRVEQAATLRQLITVAREQREQGNDPSK
jgi:hypothetical protein